jgi:dihydroxy-acid dehydratase
MNKPQVGIASMWYEGNPCNMHLLNLAEEVKRGVVSERMRQDDIMKVTVAMC